MTLTDEELKRIAKFMKTHYGIELEHKKTLICGRLDPKLKGKYDSYTDLIAKAEKSPYGEDGQLLINTLTTNHTYFMREPIHYQFLKEVILPRLKDKEAARKDIRIWSAASSTGEEAYSIMMLIKEFFGLEADSWDTKVLATDISTKALAQAQQGIYTTEKINNLPENWRRRYLKPIDDGNWQFKPEYRNEVIFRQFNLMDPFPFKRPFHTIFIRNVMIYFDEETKRQLISKMLDYLEPGGYLFTGLTETIDKSDKRLEYIQPSIYRRR